MKYEIPNRYSGKPQVTAEIDCAEDAPDSVKKGLAVRWAVKMGANLRGANLMDADLEGADLRGANLMDANLRRANLRRANLRYANLTRADLTRANLMDANLRRANLDFSCLPLWCGGLGAKVDERLARQFMYHALHYALSVNAPGVTQELLDWTNKFHRVGEVPALRKAGLLEGGKDE